MAMLQPDRFFTRLSAIDIKRDLLDVGITHALLDVDNTVRSRADNEVPADVRAWIDEARGQGVGLVLFSNSWHDATLEFGRELSLPVVMRSVKPLPFGTLHATRVVDGRRGDTVVIGDQILTDVLSAHVVGMKAYLVMPLSDVNIKSAQWQRKVEKHVLRGRVPEKAQEREEGAQWSVCTS